MLKDKNSPQKSNGSQKSLQQDVKQDVKEPSPSRKAMFASGKQLLWSVIVTLKSQPLFLQSSSLSPSNLEWSQCMDRNKKIYNEKCSSDEQFKLSQNILTNLPNISHIHLVMYIMEMLVKNSQVFCKQDKAKENTPPTSLKGLKINTSPQLFIIQVKKPTFF